MKLLHLFCFSFFLSYSVSAQEIDSRLLVKYSTEELNEMKSNAPEDLMMLTYALDNAIYVAEGGETKGQQLSSVPMPEEGMTFIDLGLEIKDQNQYFLIEGENKILVVKSKWVLNHEMQKK